MDIIITDKTRETIQNIYRKVVNEEEWKDFYDENPDEALKEFALDEDGLKIIKKILAVF